MKIITLCREYGAGGHSIGRQVAAELGIELYDKDIITKSVEAMGIDREDLEKTEEGISRFEAVIRAITPIAYELKDTMFETQSEVILRLAEKGPCVFLGRCADVVLREAGVDALNVFLYADEAHRSRRVGELLGTTDRGEIARALHKTDHDRRSYYTYYTGMSWGSPKNFHLMLDTGALGYELCAKLICEAARG